MECGCVSINRIAADDDAETVVAVFQGSITLDPQVHSRSSQYGILPLQMDDMEMVKEQLYGQPADIPSAIWQPMP
jgi:hypothetical protein